ncbi:hypothetical protein [Novosphingobium malaysiense]|uniref:Lysoplasmalogenase n=1 Tax=Novosphingobium malaysiense TaxID=1348853 RepID=A0A0B1ZLV7_9SPHN|nr:hypothetical protein [Novosphingobium malaysiense]KHK91526.1 hypothetical protein LK12_11920 [Novosphingobium malaysiense]
MPKRALIERRPWLLGSIVLALAFTWLSWLQDSRIPGTYLLAVKCAPFLLLSAYALLRHRGTDTRLLATMLVLLGIGAALSDLFVYEGTVFMIAGFAIGIGLFLLHRRPGTTASQKGAAVALLLLTPLICQALARPELQAGWAPAFFGLGLGGMAASAWMSNFPRYRVGLGAVIAVVASMLAISGAGAPDGPTLGELVGWPLFYFGLMLLATGVTGELRNRAGNAA